MEDEMEVTMNGPILVEADPVIEQGQIFILETAILATPYFQTFHYDGCTAGQKVKSGES